MRIALLSLALIAAGAGTAAAQVFRYTPELDPDRFVLTADPLSIGLVDGPHFHVQALWRSVTAIEDCAIALSIITKGAPAATGWRIAYSLPSCPRSSRVSLYSSGAVSSAMAN